MKTPPKTHFLIIDEPQELERQHEHESLRLVGLVADPCEPLTNLLA